MSMLYSKRAVNATSPVDSEAFSLGSLFGDLFSGLFGGGNNNKREMVELMARYKPGHLALLKKLAAAKHAKKYVFMWHRSVDWSTE